MKQGSSIRAALAEIEPALRPSERKVARYVMQNLEAVTRSSISHIAVQAGVSEPTVLRFCRRLGVRGFIEFKLVLAEEIASGTLYVNEAVEVADAPRIVSAKLFAAAMHHLNAVSQSLDIDALVAAADAIRGARRIDVCGVAQSNFVAADAQHQLVRMGFPAIVMDDPHKQLQAIASLSPGDAVLVVSFSGQIRETVAVAELARSVGARVIALTNSQSPLARAADIVLNVDSDEQTFLYTASGTRCAHLIVVDILATMLALKAGEPMRERLRRSRFSTRAYWIQNGAPPPRGGRERA